MVSQRVGHTTLHYIVRKENDIRQTCAASWPAEKASSRSSFWGWNMQETDS